MTELTWHRHADLSVDQHLALRTAAAGLTEDCGDACPVFPGTRYENWELDDPNGLDVADVRPIRDEIERRVRVLLDELAVPVSSG